MNGLHGSAFIRAENFERHDSDIGRRIGGNDPRDVGPVPVLVTVVIRTGDKALSACDAALQELMGSIDACIDDCHSDGAPAEGTLRSAFTGLCESHKVTAPGGGDVVIGNLRIDHGELQILRDGSCGPGRAGGSGPGLRGFRGLILIAVFGLGESRLFCAVTVFLPGRDPFFIVCCFGRDFGFFFLFF